MANRIEFTDAQDVTVDFQTGATIHKTKEHDFFGTTVEVCTDSKGEVVSFRFPRTEVREDEDYPSYERRVRRIIFHEPLDR